MNLKLQEDDQIVLEIWGNPRLIFMIQNSAMLVLTNHGFFIFFPLKVSFTKNKKEVNVDELLSQITYVMVIGG